MGIGVGEDNEDIIIVGADGKLFVSGTLIVGTTKMLVVDVAMGCSVIRAALLGIVVMKKVVSVAAVMRAAVVGAAIVGAAVMGAAVVGAAVVGAAVVGAAVVGAAVVRASIMGSVATVVAGKTLAS